MTFYDVIGLGSRGDVWYIEFDADHAIQFTWDGDNPTITLSADGAYTISFER